jgi:predicted transcriptional regulator
MSKTIELPDPLYAEIDGYARRVSASPITIIRQAWDEFRHQHPPETATPLRQTSASDELLAMVRTLRGSISLPAGMDDKKLITEARAEKHGPL